MSTTNVHEAKTKLSAVLMQIEKTGDRFVICRDGTPIAEIGPLRKRKGSRLGVHPVLSDMQINLAVEFHHLEIIPLDLNICLLASRLPPIHQDPCDRFIIALAKLRGMPVVTADHRFTEYGV